VFTLHTHVFPHCQREGINNGLSQAVTPLSSPPLPTYLNGFMFADSCKKCFTELKVLKVSAGKRLVKIWWEAAAGQTSKIVVGSTMVRPAQLWRGSAHSNPTSTIVEGIYTQ
jgi:hypothetical protein